MNVAIIGKHSFLGQKIAEKHLLQGDQVIFYSAREDSLKSEYYLSIDQRTSVIYYLPAIFKSDSTQSFHKMLNVNAFNILDLVKHVLANGMKTKIVFPSTRLIYGHSNFQQTEQSPVNPKSEYAKSKYIAESILVNELFNSNEIDYYILRLGVLYSDLDSKDENIGTLAIMKKSLSNYGNIELYGDGNLKRTFTNIHDAASVMIDLVKSGAPSGIYNCGGQDLTLSEVARFLAKDDSMLKFVEWPKEALANESGSTIFCSKKLDKFVSIKYKRLISY